ncbi:MAG: hypothetical protein L0I91_06320 [Yaniella sp.]|nr:hypothetical protein [Yaniella sp.]
MQLAEIRNLYDQDGPFATVYLEGRAPAADAEHQVRLRWDDLRGRLEKDGAGEETVTALEKAVIVDDITEVQNNGRVLVANASGVLLNADWDAAIGAGDAAHFTQEPELGAFARERARSVRMLVAIADRTGATIRRVVAAEEHELDEQAERNVTEAANASVHKPREGALSHKQIQRRADEATKQNLREVAEHLDETSAKWHPDVVVLAGEVQGRNELRDELSDVLRDMAREAENGGTDDDAAEEALAEELRSIASDVANDRTQELTERYEHAAAHDQAVEGADRVARAAELGAVETLLLEYNRSAADEAKLLGASARVDAQLGLLNTQVEDAVAAVLRFEAPDELKK